MERPRWITAYRVLFGVLTIATVAFAFNHNRIYPEFNPANFFSFFTIQSNLFAVLPSPSQPRTA